MCGRYEALYGYIRTISRNTEEPLASLKEIEQRSKHRVENSDAFQGLLVKEIDEYTFEEL